MRIEADSATPVFLQIVEGIRSAIASGVYRPGEMIPSVRQQAVASLVNPNTVQRAYEQLERDGLVVSRMGMGMVVADDAKEIARREIDQGIQEIFAKGIAMGCAAGLSQAMIDKLYRQARRETRGQSCRKMIP
ncbi:MAG TPA: GntR family transcriptional regulator [Tepidisphaeraceae bacterium]|jgi:GntR family transcriptional regulator